MAKKKKQSGLSASAKVGILIAVFGIPGFFAFSSWGLGKLYEVAPYLLVILVTIFIAAYTAYTSGLMYKFYDVNPPLLRFVPCLGEVTLLDVKYHLPCYILYLLAFLCLGATQLPYNIMKLLGTGFATKAPFYFLLIGGIFMLILQVIKGIGLVGTMKDIGADWHKQTHGDIGALTKMTALCFIPFVRVMALYALNKPLSTLVSFMGVNVNTEVAGEAAFELEEDEEDDYDE